MNISPRQLALWGYAVPAGVAVALRDERPGKGRKKKPVVEGVVYPAGTIVAAFAVKGRSVPWSVAIRCKNGGARVNPKLAAWSARVRQAARECMGGRLPHLGLYEFRACFHLRRKGTIPDIDNLVKSIHDFLQGSVIVNDRECRASRHHYDPDAAEDWASVEVIAL